MRGCSVEVRKMKSLGIALVLVGLIWDAGAGAGVAGYREARARYVGPAGGVSGPGVIAIAHCHPARRIGCVRIPVPRQSGWVSIRLVDATGLPIAAMVLDQSDAEVAFLCRKTSAPLPIMPGGHIEIWVLAGTCPANIQPSIPTTGEVVARFHSRPQRG